ncbi:MAG: MFS transporter [Phycisphaerales bacterium]|nr:MAG: MFS transporter [Phycisphaerales bacterium]
MPMLPNLLAKKWGRLATFFFLYVTEGIPLGFTATAVATQMRRQGVSPSQIGFFVGVLYLPWAWKWMIGPVVDIVYSERLGRRRVWIVAAQCAIIIALMAGMGIDFAKEMGLFTALVVVINIFAATQDVAIDALACGVLEEKERGLANGLMFAGAYCGQAVGGAGVLFLSRYVNFNTTFVFVCACILAVTLFIALPMREPKITDGSPPVGPRLRAIGGEIRGYVRRALKAFFGSRSALLAAVFAMLPCGAHSLSYALGSNLAVELGLTNETIATLALLSTMISALGCVAGGLLSDRFGRRRMLGLYIVVTVIPPLCLAVLMQRQGWIMPVDPQMEDRPVAPEVLITAYWAASLAYAAMQGLIFGTRTALFMDVCTPAVAATQFTAYMSLLNVVIWYSASWQGWAIENWGYPATLVADAATGLLCLALVPWIRKRRPGGGG